VGFVHVAFYNREALCLEDTEELILPIPDKPKTNNCSFSGFLSTKQKGTWKCLSFASGISRITILGFAFRKKVWQRLTKRLFYATYYKYILFHFLPLIPTSKLPMPHAVMNTVKAPQKITNGFRSPASKG